MAASLLDGCFPPRVMFFSLAAVFLLGGCFLLSFSVAAFLRGGCFNRFQSVVVFLLAGCFHPRWWLLLVAISSSTTIFVGACWPSWWLFPSEAAFLLRGCFRRWRLFLLGGCFPLQLSSSSSVAVSVGDCFPPRWLFLSAADFFHGGFLRRRLLSSPYLTIA